MPDCYNNPRPHRRKRRVEERYCYVLGALERPRTQSELREALGMSNSGILHLLRRLERDGLIRPAERVARTQIWEKTADQK